MTYICLFLHIQVIVEKPKVVQEIVQGGLPFKEGDKFIVPSDVKGVVYNLTDIDLTKGEVKVSWYDTTENKTKNITEKNREKT